jgi:hypothetical protein
LTLAYCSRGEPSASALGRIARGVVRLVAIGALPVYLTFTIQLHLPQRPHALSSRDRNVAPPTAPWTTDVCVQYR